MSTTTSFEIKNHAALAAFARRFAPAVTQGDEAPVPPSGADFFGTMKLAQNIELDNGPDLTIDTQLDFRYVFAYICFYVSSLYPELNTKGHPYMSPLSLVAYCQLLVFAHILVCDLSARRTASYIATAFRNDSYLKDYLNVLLSAKIPSFMIPLLEQIAPTYDPRRTRIEFIPTLAGSVLSHDFHTMIVPYVMLTAHQIVASQRSNSEPSHLLHMLYHTTLVTRVADARTIGQLFGTHYSVGTGRSATNYESPNWLNRTLESIFNPVVGRALTQKPTFAKIALEPYSASKTEFNMYRYALCASDDNIPVMQDFVNAGSRFITSEDSKTFPLGTLLQKVSGIALLSHWIEPITLPTDTHLKTATFNSTTATTFTHANSKTFATQHSFATAYTQGTETLKYPKSAANPDVDQNLLLQVDSDYDDTAETKIFVKFDTKTHTAPYVLYFQPYDVSPSSLGFTIALGIRIMHAEIDGLGLPLEDCYASLVDNNSQYLQAAIPVSKIRRLNYGSTSTAGPILQRAETDSAVQKIIIAFRNMSQNVLPFFTRTEQSVKTPGPALIGFTRELNATDPNLDPTVYSTVDNIPQVTDGRIIAWSSYRIVHKQRPRTANDVAMIVSFRPFYGTNVTLSRSKNPTILLPK